MSGSIDDSQVDGSQAEQSKKDPPDSDYVPNIDAETSSSSAEAIDARSQHGHKDAWAEMDRVLSDDDVQHSSESITGSAGAIAPVLQPPITSEAPLSMVETAFLASTASLLWLVSYYLSIGPWMRIFFPAPIALVYLRWGARAAWMSTIVSCLLLSVLMGPYLSLLFFIPYGLLGVQLGMLWRRGAGWPMSIGLSTIVSTFSFFFRLWILSAFIGEDLWVYLTGRITDLLAWISNRLVDWGLLGVGMLGQPDVTVVQIATVVMVICSDIVYLFTVHLAAWLLFERLGNAIPEPPTWVKILLEEE